MPKLDLTKALRIKNSAGEFLALKAPGVAWPSQPTVRSMAFPAPGARFDMDFAGARFHGGIQPLDTNDDDGRFFRQQQQQQIPTFSENVDGSLRYWPRGEICRITTKGLIVHDYMIYSYVLQNRDLANATWVKTGCTAAKNITGRDQRAAQASSLTVTADGATLMQTLTLHTAASLRKPFLDVKRISGSGAVELTTDGGVTWEVLDLSDVRFDGWARCTLPMRSVAANAVVGFRFGKAGDVFGIDFLVLSDKEYDHSPIQTTTQGIRKIQDRPVVGQAGSNIGATKAGLWEFYAADQAWGIYAEGAFRNNGNIFSQYLSKVNGAFKYMNFSNQNTKALDQDAALTRPYPLINKMLGIRDAAGNARFCVNGGPVLKGSGFQGTAKLNHSDVMGNGAGSLNPDGFLRRMVFFETPMTDEEMQAWTSV